MGVIHEHDVVTRVMRLDEIHLEDEALFVGPDYDRVEMMDVRDHGRDLPLLRAQEIMADPLFEVFGLADIDDSVIFVLHQIAARLIWKQIYLGF